MDDQEETFTLSVEECLRWVDRLERFSTGFEQKGDENNAKLMSVCSILMSKLALDVECQLTGPFPTKAGAA
jgi:hypothetical protein